MPRMTAAAEKIRTMQNENYDKELVAALKKQHGSQGPLESSSTPFPEVMHFFYTTFFPTSPSGRI